MRQGPCPPEAHIDDYGKKIQKCNYDQNDQHRGAWVAQWLKAAAFGSGHDLRVLGSSPASDSLLSREPASPFSLPASLPTCDLSLCQINK